MRAGGKVIALLGAESTGKTTLAAGLRDALSRPGRSVAMVSEYLREFCDRERRTPRPEEQALIAAEQTRRIAAARQAHDLVVADTTALMTAVYSEKVFGDSSLYPMALAAHAGSNGQSLTLLTSLDLPWQPDGLQRDGPQVRSPVDAMIRAALARGRVRYAMVTGSGAQRLQSAMRSVQHWLGEVAAGNTQAATGQDTAPAARRPPSASSVRWRWHCDRCGDPACERWGLARLTAADVHPAPSA